LLAQFIIVHLDNQTSVLEIHNGMNFEVNQLKKA